MTTSTGDAPPRGLSRQDVFSALGTLGAVLTLVTAVLFYFGWRRSDVQASAMSIDVSLFGFSSQDYVLRSISSLYVPLLVIFGLGLAWVWVHQRVTLRLASATDADRRRAVATRTGRAAVALAALAGACLVVTVVAGLGTPPPLLGGMLGWLADRQWVVPLVLVVATVTAAYLWWLHRQVRPPRAAAPGPAWQTLLPAALVAGIVVLGGFWMLEEYASAVGRGRAQELSRGVDRLARAVVLSPAPLGIRAPGVREQRIGVAGRPDVRYRTTGLRLLARSGGKVLLVHDGWSPRTGIVVVLPDADSLTWEFSR